MAFAAHPTVDRATWPQPSARAAVEPVAAGDAGAAVSMMSDVLKPYFLLACVAFFVGFASYLVIQRTVAAAAPANFEATAPISASAPPVEASLARLHSI